MTILPAVVTIENLPLGTTPTGTELIEAVQTSGGVASSVQLTLSQVVSVAFLSQPVFFPSTAIPAGGSSSLGIGLSSAVNFGLYFGSGVPTLSAATGSLYLRSDGSGTTSRLYVNADGSTTWTGVITET